MLTDVRLPVPDQTIESLVAATWLRNPWPTWEEAAAIVFGSAKTKSRRLVHSGWREAFTALRGAGYSTPDEFVAAHSYLPLFQPFMEVATYERLRSALVEGQVAKLSALSRSRVLAVGPFRFCPQCSARETAQRGYAVAHRSHQVAGVVACWEHGGGLVDLRANERSAINLGDRGLHIPCLEESFSRTPCLSNQQERVPTPADLRYARFVHAALSGGLVTAALQVRQLAFNERLEERFQARRAPGSTIARLISHGHSRPALCEAGLDITSQGTAIWPALVADGPVFAHHPMANLFVISVLFDDVDDYGGAIATASKVGGQREPALCGLRLGNLKNGMTSALIKDFLRDIPLARVAASHKLDLATTKAVLREFPRLALHRKRATFARRLNAHREAALALKQSHPRAARQDLKTLANGAFVWLADHDRQWLDSNFPMRGPLHDKNSFYDVNLDISTATTAVTVLDQLAREGRDHLRRNWSVLLNCFSEDVQRQLRTGRLPIAATSLREREESKAQHRDRCLRRIQEHVEASRLREARLWARELLLTNPGDRAVIGRLLACLLPDASLPENEAGLEAAYASS